MRYVVTCKVIKRGGRTRVVSIIMPVKGDSLEALRNRNRRSVGEGQAQKSVSTPQPRGTRGQRPRSVDLQKVAPTAAVSESSGTAAFIGTVNSQPHRRGERGRLHRLIISRLKKRGIGGSFTKTDNFLPPAS